MLDAEDTEVLVEEVSEDPVAEVEETKETEIKE